jgi:hypothetical protein
MARSPLFLGVCGNRGAHPLPRVAVRVGPGQVSPRRRGPAPAPHRLEYAPPVLAGNKGRSLLDFFLRLQRGRERTLRIWENKRTLWSKRSRWMALARAETLPSGETNGEKKAQGTKGAGTRLGSGQVVNRSAVEAGRAGGSCTISGDGGCSRRDRGNRAIGNGPTAGRCRTDRRGASVTVASGRRHGSEDEPERNTSQSHGVFPPLE